MVTRGGGRFDIIATIPQSWSADRIARVADGGVTIARINGAFTPLERIPSLVARIRRAAGRRVRIILDLSGPKIRFTRLPARLPFTRGSVVTLKRGYFNHPEFFDGLRPGLRLRVNDGANVLVCRRTGPDAAVCVADSEGAIEKGRGLQLGKADGRKAFSLTELDRSLIRLGEKLRAEYLGVSFVNGPQDVRHVRGLLTGRGTVCVPKIESRQSLLNLRAILADSKLVIVDRGDLAGEIGVDRIWEAQRRILAAARRSGTRVILATQVLTNMIHKPVPTIAEIDSLYGLLALGIQGVQLSNETYLGRYPEEAVRVVREAYERSRRRG